MASGIDVPDSTGRQIVTFSSELLKNLLRITFGQLILIPDLTVLF
jgi:hypothetical protein